MDLEPINSKNHKGTAVRAAVDVEEVKEKEDKKRQSVFKNQNILRKKTKKDELRKSLKKQREIKSAQGDISNWWKKINNWVEDSSPIPITQKIFFIKNLSVMLKAGLSLGQALSALKEQVPNKRLKKILFDVSAKVEKGEFFADALKNYPKVFDRLFVNMVSSGEVSGNLEGVLEQLYNQLKRNHELVSKVRGAMIYPIIVITAMVGIGAAMIVFVMPKFISIFEDFQTQLPLPTRILIAISNFIQQHGLLVASLIIFLVIAFIKFIKTDIGCRIMHKFYLVAPILSPIVKKINLARFSRTTSSLIKTNIPIVKSFKITAETMSNLYYRQALLEAAEKIKKGARVDDVLREHPKLFPPVVTQMVTVGENSGSIDQILTEVANFYEEEVNQIMKNMPSIIEPILMLVLGAGVGFMAISVLMPMYSLSQAI